LIRIFHVPPKKSPEKLRALFGDVVKRAVETTIRETLNQEKLKPACVRKS